jgi:hypothetical protein
LESLPSYEALSYVWGKASDRSTILCHGKPISITRSLESALRRFRLRNELRTIWADAICINQQDLQERGSQVLLMREIYQRAARVLIWLGQDEKRRADGVFRFTKFLADVLSKSDIDAAEITAVVQERWSEEAHWFSEALVNAWFRRVWILQEAGLAADALVVWGDAAISWNIWTEVCDFLASCKEGWAADIALNTSFNGISTVSSISLLNFKFGDDMHVGKVLHLARNFRSTLAHDKVYGLLGHPAFRTFCRNHRLESFVPVDYAISHLDIYRAVAIRLLHEPNPLYCLCLSQHSPRRISFRPETDISWVPQWIRSEPDLLHDEFETHLTSGSTSPSFSTLGNVLHLKGVMVDTVTFCSENIAMYILLRVKKGEPTEKNNHPFTTTWTELQQTRHPSRPSEEDIVRDLCNTLSVGGLRRDEGRRRMAIADDEQLADCCKYLNDLGIPFSSHINLASRSSVGGDDSRFLQTIQLSRFRCLFVTKNGYLGLGPRVVQPSDIVCVFFGGPMPFVLHPGSSDGEYRFSGEAYVNGLMKGEAIDMWKAGRLMEQEFKLV